MLTERTSRWQKAIWVSVSMGLLSAMVVLAMPRSWVLGAELRAILHVEYTASSISVEAHNVSLQDVLVAVGKQVGFTVISIGKINPPVIHVSLHDASVEEVLDTLLGGRNYGMSYQLASAKSVDRIDKVFVLGAPESEGAVTSRVGKMGDPYPAPILTSKSQGTP